MVDDNVIKRDGQTWNKDCNTCSCNNGKVICEPKSCDCNAIRGLNYADISTSNEDKEDFNVKCCSHCFSGEEGNKSCTDSEDQVKHQDGDRWIHECQQCECKVCVIRTVIKKNLAKLKLVVPLIQSITYYLLMILQNGESDCWPIQCPPIFCARPILLPGSCCPTCVNIFTGDCHQRNNSVSSKKKSCFHNGQQYRNEDVWPVVENADDSSQHENGCTSCKCKVNANGFVSQK